MSANKRVVKTLSLHNKFELIKEVETGAKKKDVAVKYGIPRSTVSTILKNKTKVIDAIESGNVRANRKRLKKGNFENVDDAVLQWFKAKRNQNVPVSGPLIKEKALEFAGCLGENNFKASTGWLDNWKRR